ncbi:MAG TPA: hypothetical protein VLL08_08635 [Kineosporiaceae bacterium]|nr:hypothetical protein [Kineosporiaceae bacterium]
MTSDVTTLDDATLSPGTTPGGRHGRHPRWTALVVTAAVVSLGALTGCGGSSTGATAVDSANPNSSTSSSGDTPSKASGDTSSKAPYTDAEACAWLKENLPKVPDTKVGAAAQLAIGLSAFFEDHGGLAGADGYALDEAFVRGCPALRTQALKKAGIESFGNL